MMQTGACYIRVSTEEQIEFSPEAQRRAIFSYAEKNDIYIPDAYIFMDEGISGRVAEKRPAFMKMIAAAKSTPCPFSVILVHKFDRFARNRQDSVVYKSLLRKECNIRVISVTEQLEDDKFSIILESMLEAMAEYYSLNLAEEVKKGMFEKARRGEHIGKAPYGYCLCSKVLKPHPFESTVVKRIFQLFTEENKTIPMIARHLNDRNLYTRKNEKWRSASVRYLLQNPVYTGMTRYNYMGNGSKNPKDDWILAQGRHEPLISFSQYQTAEKKLAETTDKKYQKPSLLYSFCQQIAVCAYCGRFLSVSTSGQGKYASFRCASPACPVKSTWSVSSVEKNVLTALANELTPFPAFSLLPSKDSSAKKELLLLQKQAEKIKSSLTLAKRAYYEQVDSLEEYQKNKQELTEKMQEIERDIASARKEASDTHPLLVISSVRLLFGSFFTLEQKQKIAAALIKTILVDTNTKEIQIIFYA